MPESLNIGLQLTAIGMGLVFALLALLWGLEALLLKLDRAPAEPQVSDADESPARVVTAPEGLDPALAAAITLAVVTHQAVRRKQAAPAMRTHWPGSLPSRWVGVGRSRQTRSWVPDRR